MAASIPVPVAVGTADALEASSAEAVVQARGPRCRNCGAAASGRYCPDCGQATALHPPSVREFVHEFIAHNVAFEGSLWRTLYALVVRPGRLTVEYFAGRRQRYVGPLRLYLTFSLILFAVSSASSDNLRVGGIFQIGLAEQQQSGPGTVHLRPGHYADTGIEPVDRVFHRIAKMTPAERMARVASSVKQFLPYVLIALVPVLALYLQLLYWNRHRLYGEHLVVAFHAQTAAFVFGSIIGLLPDGSASDAIDAVLILTVVVQGVVALRRVYGGRTAFTIVRSAVLFAAYGLTAAVAVAALTFASLAV